MANQSFLPLCMMFGNPACVHPSNKLQPFAFLLLRDIVFKAVCNNFPLRATSHMFFTFFKQIHQKFKISSYFKFTLHTPPPFSKIYLSLFFFFSFPLIIPTKQQKKYIFKKFTLPLSVSKRLQHPPFSKHAGLGAIVINDDREFHQI